MTQSLNKQQENTRRREEKEECLQLLEQEQVLSFDIVQSQERRVIYSKGKSLVSFITNNYTSFILESRHAPASGATSVGRWRCQGASAVVCGQRRTLSSHFARSEEASQDTGQWR